MSFERKVVIVTGATSGIGRATAEAFGRERASIAVVGRNEGALADVAASVRASGGQAVACPADLLTVDAGARVVDAAVTAFGGVDVLVNAAGIIASGTLEQTTDAMWDQMIGVDLTAPFRLMRAADHIRRRV